MNFSITEVYMTSKQNLLAKWQYWSSDVQSSHIKQILLKIQGHKRSNAVTSLESNYRKYHVIITEQIETDCKD